MNTKKYMPPFLKKNQDFKNDQTKTKEQTNKDQTKKEQTKKDQTKKEQTKVNFELKEELFPLLKNNENNGDKTISKENRKIINYTTILNPDLNKSLSSPLNEDNINEEDTNNPGWIYIQKNKSNGMIEYKYGPEVINDELFYKNEKYLDTCNLRSRIARLQWDRDREIDHLGDLSYNYNKPSIRQMLESARYENKSIKHKKINVRIPTTSTINHIKNKEMKTIMEKDDEPETEAEEDASLSSDSNEDN
jgi:hypothetical protein